MLRVGIFVYEGVEELDFVGVLEVLGAAKRVRPTIDLDVKVHASTERLKGANGLQFMPDVVGYDLADRDLLVVPGGKGRIEASRDLKLLSLIRDFASSRQLASVCTGALILDQAGVLKGRRVTTHHASRHLLRDAATVAEDRVVEDGNIITAGGVTCSIDLGLWILRRFFDEELAGEVASRIEYPQRAKT